MKKLLITIIFPVMLFVTGCSWLPDPHRIDIQQGNIISQEDVDQLKVGMSKKQVLFVMGSPVIQDTFHPARWDYYYSLERGRVAEPTNHVSLSFLGDQLITINGDMLPQLQANAENKPKHSDVITIIPKEEKVGLSGLIDSMINAVKSDDAESVAQPKTITKPQAPSTSGQKKEKSGGFFDSFIKFFKGDSSDKQKATSSSTKPAPEQVPTTLKQTIPGLNLDSFMRGDDSSDKTGDKANDSDAEVEPSVIPDKSAQVEVIADKPAPVEVIPDEPAPVEVLPAEQSSSATTQDSPDTTGEEQPGTGLNLDAFIKPYSADKKVDESRDNNVTEQHPH